MTPRLAPRWVHGLTLALATVAVLVGCDGASDSEEPAPASTRTDTSAQESPQVPPEPPEGRLTDEGTPGRAALDTFRYIRLGAIPAAMVKYEPRVRRVVGVLDLATALQYLQSAVSGYEPRVERVEPTDAGPMVVLRARAREGISPLYTYVLRRSGGDWVIVYDTLLEGALRTAVAQRVQAGIDPDAAEPSAKAVAAGVDAASRFRGAGLGE